MKVITIGSLLLTGLALAGGAFPAQAPVITDPDKADTPPPVAKTPGGDAELPAPLVIPKVGDEKFDFSPKPGSPFGGDQPTNPPATADERAKELQKEFAGGEIGGGEPTKPTDGDFKIPEGGDFSIPKAPVAEPKDRLADPLEETNKLPADPLGDPKTGDPEVTDPLEPAATAEPTVTDPKRVDPKSPLDPKAFDPKFVDPTDPKDPPVDPLNPSEPNPLDPPEAATPTEEKIDAPDPVDDPTDNETDESGGDTKTGEPSNRPAPAFRIPKSAKAPSRLWMDSTSRFTLTASFVSVKDDTVVLRHTDGGDWNIPVSQLSRKDQGYIWAYDNQAEAKAMRSWSNGQYAEFVHDGSTRQRGKITTSSGVESTLSVDSLSPYDQGVLEALVGMGK